MNKQTINWDHALEEDAYYMLDKVSDGIFMADSDGTIKYFNNTICKILLLENNIEGMNYRDVFLKGQEKNKELLEFVENVITTDSAIRKKTLPYYLPNGEILHLLVYVKMKIEDDENGASIEKVTVFVSDVTEHYRIKTMVHDSAHIFTGLIASIVVYLSIWSFLKFTLRISLNTVVYTYMIEIIAVVLFFDILLFTKFSFRDIGLLVDKSTLKRNLKETLIIAGIAIGTLTLARCAQIVFDLGGKPYFIGGTWKGCSKYILTAVVQEFLSRGVMQTANKYLLQIKNQKAISIAVTSLIFMIMHIPYGFTFMIGAGLLSVALGIIYERQGNIWGTSFLHWLVGYVAMAYFF